MALAWLWKIFVGSRDWKSALNASYNWKLLPLCAPTGPGLYARPAGIVPPGLVTNCDLVADFPAIGLASDVRASCWKILSSLMADLSWV